MVVRRHNIYIYSRPGWIKKVYTRYGRISMQFICVYLAATARVDLPSTKAFSSGRFGTWHKSLPQMMGVILHLPSPVVRTHIWGLQYIKELLFSLPKNNSCATPSYLLCIYICLIGRHRISFGLRFLSERQGALLCSSEGAV